MTRLDQFLAFSADVTAFTVFQLRGTGQAEAYLGAVTDVVGEELVGDLLDRHQALGTGELDDLLRREIFSDERLGPIARNIVKLWFVGTWYELPAAWRERFGPLDGDVTFTVSAMAYTEGLLWPAIGANPPGAKGPGYGSWSGPPLIPEIA
ncbi:hypothetical protein OM076_07650 [Solirubrobacter ginsenosidimutans]|uniref:Uncharacterized protein n=1 Tax=Solirubrobacter ginsenosidimutans TaxID=490573 RepID=A0A9X3MNZ9_9ACTN|nr:hypothetical protein [Solirubrobacter ginsenosidimutans]MDA0160131.1 hypothetical protein [Solirubrobacter ginsenosidimutans]